MSNCIFCDKGYPTTDKHLIITKNQKGNKYHMYVSDYIYKKIQLLKEEYGSVEDIVINIEGK